MSVKSSPDESIAQILTVTGWEHSFSVGSLLGFLTEKMLRDCPEMGKEAMMSSAILVIKSVFS